MDQMQANSVKKSYSKKMLDLKKLKGFVLYQKVEKARWGGRFLSTIEIENDSFNHFPESAIVFTSKKEATDLMKTLKLSRKKGWSVLTIEKNFVYDYRYFFKNKKAEIQKRIQWQKYDFTTLTEIKKIMKEATTDKDSYLYEKKPEKRERIQKLLLSLKVK